MMRTRLSFALQLLLDPNALRLSGREPPCEETVAEPQYPCIPARGKSYAGRCLPAVLLWGIGHMGYHGDTFGRSAAQVSRPKGDSRS